MLEVFDNDEKYLAHIAKYPAKLVLNAHKIPKAFYVVLHRATCSSISRISGIGKEGGFTERTFLKVVSDQEEEIKEWMRSQNLPGEFSSVCKICFK